jgi:hypothetical protein
MRAHMSYAAAPAVQPQCVCLLSEVLPALRSHVAGLELNTASAWCLLSVLSCAGTMSRATTRARAALQP